MREGYVCVDVEGGGGAGVTVTVGSMGHGGAGTVTSTLNGEVNSYIEVSIKFCENANYVMFMTQYNYGLRSSYIEKTTDLTYSDV